jgi:WD40 repeat protein
VAAHQAELDAEAERYEEQVRHNRRLRTLVAVATVVAVIAAAAGIFALAQRSRANDEAAAAEELADDAFAAAEEAGAATAEADAAAKEAAAAAAEADRLRDEAERQALVESARFLSVAAEEAIADDPDLAVLLAVEAAKRQVAAGVDVEGPISALFATTSAHEIDFRETGVGLRFISQQSVSTEPDGDRAAIVIADVDGPGGDRVDVVDLRTDERVTMSVEAPTTVAWHATRNEIAIADAAGVIWSANPDTGDASALLDTGAASSHVWTFDDDWLVYRANEGTAGVGPGEFVVADADTFAPVVRRGGSWASLAPDGRHVLIMGPIEGPALYALPSGEFIGVPYIGGSDAVRMTWEPDGEAMLVMSAFVGPTSELSGVLRRISVPDLVETVQEFPDGPPPWPSSLSVSPDGSRIAVGGSEGEVSVYALDSLELQTEFTGHQVFVAGIDWASGVQQLLTLDRARQVIGWQLSPGDIAPASTDVGSTRFPGDSVLRPDGTRVVSTRNADVTLGPIEVWSEGTARVATPVETDDLIALGPAGTDDALVAIGTPDGIRIDDALSGITLAEFRGDLNGPSAFSPDGRILVAGNGGFLVPAEPRDGPQVGTRRLAAVAVDDGRELWSLPNVVPWGPIAFDPVGDTLFVTTGPYGSHPDARGPELIVVDTATGDELATRPLRSGAYGGVTMSPSGSVIAVYENGAGDVGAFVYVFDVAALLSGDDAVITETELPGGVTPLDVAFSEDESTLFVPDGDFFGGEVLALAIDDGLEIRWSLDVGDVNVAPVVDDGLLWFPWGEPDSDGALRFDFVGIPSDLAEYTEWAATLPARDLTEAECERYLDGPCAEVVTPLPG